MALFSTLAGIKGSGGAGLQLELLGSEGTYTTNEPSADKDSVKLTGTVVVEAYRDLADGRCKIAVIENLNGTPSESITTVDTSNSTAVTIDKLTDNSVIVFYQTGGNWTYRVITGVTGTPSVGSANTFSVSGSAGTTDVAMLTSTTAILLYTEQSLNRMYYRIVSGLDTSPTEGAEQTIQNFLGNSIRVKRLTDTSAVIGFTPNSSGTLIDYRIYQATNLGGSPSLSGATTIDSATQSGSANRACDIVVMNSTTALLVTTPNADGIPELRLVTSLDGTPSVGSAVDVGSLSTAAVVADKLNENTVALATNVGNTTLRIYRIDDVLNTPTVSSPTTVSSTANQRVDIAALSSNRVLLTYVGSSSSDGHYQLIK